jgi:hypothetical protein
MAARTRIRRTVAIAAPRSSISLLDVPIFGNAAHKAVVVIVDSMEND